MELFRQSPLSSDSAAGLVVTKSLNRRRRRSATPQRRLLLHSGRCVCMLTCSSSVSVAIFELFDAFAVLMFLVLLAMSLNLYSYSIGMTSSPEDIVYVLQKFSLSDKEKGDICLDEKDVCFSVDECERSLFRCIFGTKKINFSGLKCTMSSIWPIRDLFLGRDLGKNLFQFVFKTQSDKKKVLGGKVVNYGSQYLILKEWNDKDDFGPESFTHVDLWVQIWNLPSHWLCADSGIRIGEIFSSVSDVVIPELSNYKGRCIKILVSIDLTKPLLRGTFIKLGEKSVWVEFKYENLMTFCFYCGRVGHFEKACCFRKDDISYKSLKEGQYGDWIRDDSFGLGARFEKRFGNEEIHTPSPESGAAKACSIPENVGSSTPNPPAVQKFVSPDIASTSKSILDDEGCGPMKVDLFPEVSEVPRE
ncbi:hypothetical protein DH2020_034552 [Rehmannia glutinosa]|uniref:CCHC-type domain-containing protein n=1 Tax=Rehmannia glutinosa TaxID=99300 RepID=A0ABR0VCW8_REHGL